MRNAIAAALLGAFGTLLFAASGRAETIQIKIQNLAFTPQRVSAHVGDTIAWVNADFFAHTATARNGAWDLIIPVNRTKSVVVKAAGTVEYYCKFHPNMIGTVDVTK
ncbi:MAG TPA: cupredoxin domain-containing protein [Xanthobacteraceae bacterium]|nr:cupredoxin domain-containing protein [Xanthobacteraceae bacterium]